MSLPHLLTPLTEREAVTDAVYRAIEGFDNNDVSIFDSAFSGQNVVFDLNGNVINGTDTIRTGIIAKVGPMDTTRKSKDTHKMRVLGISQELDSSSTLCPRKT
jgi:hypothetical protein